MNEQKRDLGLPVAVIISGLLIALSIYGTGGIKIIGSQGNEANVGGEQPKEIIVKEVTSADHVWGDMNAPVKIITYTDLECPFCKRFHMTMKEIMGEYGKTGKVAWVMRQFPLDQLHSQARKEAEATECVALLGGNEKFWSFLNKIMDATESNDGLDMALLPKFAGQVGISSVEYGKCMDSGKTKATVEASQEDGLAAGARGTPYSIVITKEGDKLPIDGALPYETIKSAIEYALGNK